MRPALLALVMLLAAPARAQECVTCWTDACRDLSGYLPRCQAQVPAPQGATSFASTPPGAEVRVDGAIVCARTPCSAAVAPGPHEVEMSLAGHETARTVVTLAPGGSMVLPLAEQPTTLLVHTIPPGLPVSIDGAPAVVSPAGPVPVAPGEHIARIDEPCLEGATGPLRIERGERRSVTLTATRAHASLRIDLPPGRTAVVLVDGKLAGGAPAAYDVDACATKLTVVFDDGQRTELPLSLEANTTQTFDLTPPAKAPAPPPAPAPAPAVSPRWPAAALQLVALLPLTPHGVSAQVRLAVEEAIRARFVVATRDRGTLVLSDAATKTALARHGVTLGTTGCDATCRSALLATVTPTTLVTGLVEQRGATLVVTLEQDGVPATRETFTIGDLARLHDGLAGVEALLPRSGARPAPGAFAPTAPDTRFTWGDAAAFCASLALDRPLRLATGAELLATTMPATGNQSWDVWTATASDDDRCHATWVTFLPDGRPERADWAHASIEGTRVEAVARCVEGPSDEALPLEPRPRCATRAAPDVALRAGVGALEGLWGLSLEYKFTALAEAAGSAGLGTLGLSLGTGDRSFALGATFGPWDNRGGWWGSAYVLWNTRGVIGRDTSADEVSVGVVGGWDFRPARYLSVRVGAGWHHDPADVAPLGPVSLEVAVGAVGALSDWW